jgi:hypothetical protein
MFSVFWPWDPSLRRNGEHVVRRFAERMEIGWRPGRIAQTARRVRQHTYRSSPSRPCRVLRGKRQQGRDLSLVVGWFLGEVLAVHWVRCGACLAKVTRRAFVGEHADVMSSLSHGAEDAEGSSQVLRLYGGFMSTIAKVFGTCRLLSARKSCARFEMVDHDLDWRDLTPVEEFGDPSLLEREVIGEYFNTWSRLAPAASSLR